MRLQEICCEGNVDIISHSGTIIVSIDTEAAADKEMQIHSGILMKLKLSNGMGGFYGN